MNRYINVLSPTLTFLLTLAGTPNATGQIALGLRGGYNFHMNGIDDTSVMQFNANVLL